jgi:hypothetical protein
MKAFIDIVRIRVRIGSQHPLVCLKRRLNGAVLQLRPEKVRPVSQQLWHDKDPSPLKGPERRTQAKICNISLVMVTSPYK